MTYFLRYLLVFVFVLATQTALSQPSETLEKRLLEQIASCNGHTHNPNETHVAPNEVLILDATNGYLKKVHDGTDCGCIAYAKAYANEKGEHTFLTQAYQTCHWLRKCDANRNLADVLPLGFGIEAFLPQQVQPTSTSVVRFYLEAFLPRQGTNTRVMLKPLPAGLTIESDRIWLPQISDQPTNPLLKVSTRSMAAVEALVQLIECDEALQHIAAGAFEQLTDNELDALDEALQAGGATATRNEIQNNLLDLQQTYALYTQLACEAVVLEWDPHEARFYILEKGPQPNPVSFLVFLQNIEYWTPSPGGFAVTYQTTIW